MDVDVDCALLVVWSEVVKVVLVDSCVDCWVIEGVIGLAAGELVVEEVGISVADDRLWDEVLDGTAAGLLVLVLVLMLTGLDIDEVEGAGEVVLDIGKFVDDGSLVNGMTPTTVGVKEIGVADGAAEAPM